MNHPHRTPFPGRFIRRLPRFVTLLILLLLTGGLLAPPAAFGQRAGGGGLPNDLKTATDAKPRAAEVEKWVAAQVARLQKGKPNEQQAARDLLARESGVVGAAASPSYLQVYSAALNKQLVPLAKAADPRARLNAAIALQRVARNANNAALADAATAFAADPSAGVSLWATKASQAILPPLTATGRRSKLTGAIVEGVRKHPGQPELVEEAYRALTLELKADPQAVPALLPDVLRLFEARVQQYRTGTPPGPGLDERGAIFLTSARVWGHPEAKKFQPAIMQQLANLIGLAAQHAAAREGNTAREPYTKLLRGLGEALTVVAGPQGTKDATLQAAAKELTTITPGLDNDVLTERVDAAFTAIKARFPDTKAAPEIEADAVDDPEVMEEPPADAELDADAPPDDEGGDEPADEGGDEPADR